jgi:predicted negative regulator of RcsB-dependent stress response
LEGNFVDDLLSEKEQIEQIRTWWSEYGGYVIGGLGLGIAVLAGYNFYENSRIEAQTGGSAAYETLIGHVASGDLDEAEAVADSIETEYADTVYAAQARLAMARMFMEKNRDQDAADVLRELLDSDAETAIKHVARTRLARILLYQDDAQGVVDLLEGQESEAFAATWNELLGDAYRELGRIADAQAAYQKVLLDPMAQATVNQQLVQWKVLDLPEQQTGASEPAPSDVPVGEPTADDAAAEPATEDGE